jgi:H+/Cl- antiporter ClcA
MPTRAETLLRSAFAKASIPMFDFVSLLAALLLANCSLITALLSEVTVEPLKNLVHRDRLPPLARLLFGFVIMCGVVLASSLTSEDA